MRSLVLLAFLVVSSNLWGNISLQEIYDNNQAVNLSTEEDLNRASEILHNLVSSNPNAAIPKLNLAGLYSANQDPVGAIGLLEELLESVSRPEIASKLSDSELSFIKFVANFNLGFLNSLEEKSQKQAVQFYAKALEIEPNDIATKLNIELITKSDQGKGEGENQNQDDQKQDSKDQKDDKDQNSQQQKKKQQQKDPKYEDQKKGQKPKFKENDLKKQDVKRIFQELKRQEEKIRAKMNEKQQQEPESDKDW